jgi:type II pantothenate kinase
MSADTSQADKAPIAAEDGGTSPTISKNLRMRTDTAEIDSTITHPGSVKINVKGAFIVDHDPESPSGKTVNGGSYDTKDIRLPNHTAVVSHIAVDVCSPHGLCLSYS